MKAISAAECVAVVVTFQPDLARLSLVLSRLAPQVDGIVLVDNGSRCADELARSADGTRITLIPLPSNAGIAAAQNRGIAEAVKRGAEHVLLLDQDTVVGTDTVAILRDTLVGLVASGRRVAAVGPTYRESNSGTLSRVWRARGLKIARAPSLDGLHEGDFIIASGAFIPVATLKAVGLKEEGLFIDLVDVEWCLRARHVGYASFQIGGAIVDHTLGEGRVRLPFLRVPRHVPVRNYYWVRNALLLLRRPYVPVGWRVFFAKRVLAFALVYPVFGDARPTRARLILRGVWDGLRGRDGRLDEKP